MLELQQAIFERVSAHAPRVGARETKDPCARDFGFLVWGYTEAAQQALTLIGFDRWRLAYLAGAEAVRSSMLMRTALHDSVWDAMYLLLLIAFLLGNVLYVLAMCAARASVARSGR